MRSEDERKSVFSSWMTSETCVSHWPIPVMNGLELYLAIKKVTPNAVAIRISGKDEEFEAIAKEAVRHTAYTILQKPLDLDHVLAMLERITSPRTSDHLRKPSEDGP